MLPCGEKLPVCIGAMLPWGEEPPLCAGALLPCDEELRVRVLLSMLCVPELIFNDVT